MPELALSGYYFLSKKELMRTAIFIKEKSLPRLVKLAAFRDMAIAVGFPEIDGEEIYNSAAFITPEREIRIYRKMHLFDSEKLVFSRASSGFPVFEYRGAKIGMLICFDHFFPEAARTLALNGAEIICHCANLVIPEKAQLTTRVRAIENGIYWIMSNRTGLEINDNKTVKFTGGSHIVAPDGEILVHADEKSQGCAVMDVDPNIARDKNINERNNLFEDRRPDFYQFNPSINKN